MLSRNDIKKEIGKGICLHPLHPENIKENSINLTLSHYAWTTKGGDYYTDENGNCYIYTNRKNHTGGIESMKRGDSCVVGKKRSQKILLFPHQTTIVETSEVVAIGDYIGGSLHSKVSVVAKGIGHIGTMLGPGYCGHLMISLHNITDEIVEMKVGETFLSVTFDYLDTSVTRTSSTISGHVDKLSEYGIVLDASSRDYLTADWKNSFAEVQKRMFNSENYVRYSAEQKREKWKAFCENINLGNFVRLGIIIAVLVLLYFIASYADSKSGTSIWTDRFWNVGLSGIVVTILNIVWNSMKGNRGK